MTTSHPEIPTAAPHSEGGSSVDVPPPPAWTPRLGRPGGAGATTIDSLRSSRPWLSRLGWTFLFAIPLAVVITATQLTPDPAGMGTHQQLGLPPCGFLQITGIPCPGCGLTTSFSNMVRLRFVAAANANPFGIMLFLVTFFTIPVAAVGFVRRLRVLDTLERLHADKWAILLSVASIIVWMVRIGKHIAHSYMG